MTTHEWTVTHVCEATLEIGYDPYNFAPTYGLRIVGKHGRAATIPLGYTLGYDDEIKDGQRIGFNHMDRDQVEAMWDLGRLYDVAKFFANGSANMKSPLFAAWMTPAAAADYCVILW